MWTVWKHLKLHLLIKENIKSINIVLTELLLIYVHGWQFIFFYMLWVLLLIRRLASLSEEQKHARHSAVVLSCDWTLVAVNPCNHSNQSRFSPAAEVRLTQPVHLPVGFISFYFFFLKGGWWAKRPPPPVLWPSILQEWACTASRECSMVSLNIKQLSLEESNKI